MPSWVPGPERTSIIVREALIIKNLTNIQSSQKSITTGINIKHIPIPKTDIVTAINGFRILKIFVAVAAPINWATALTVNIQDRVFTVVPQFAASVGRVGPVTLKKSPIDILAPTIAAMNSLVAHLGLNISNFCDISIKKLSVILWEMSNTEMRNDRIKQSL